MAETFFSDIEIPGQYYGVLVRSSIERGRLVDIKMPPLPDGYFMYTATDIPGENRLSALGTTIPIFTPYEIQYSGEPVGIIVGPDLDTVQELVSEVVIEAEPLEPFHFGGTFAASQVVGKRVLFSGDCDAELAASNRVFETTCAVGPQDHFYAEPLGVSVNFSDGKLEISTATQWPFHIRSCVSAVLDLDSEDIVVIPTTLGEALDGKIWYPSLLAAQASLAAVLCRKPVKILFSRQEDFLFSPKSAPVEIRHRTALTDDGHIAAMSVRILVNAGAYSPLIDEILDRMTVTATGLYRAKTYRIEAFALRTNLPPMGALAGWGESQTQFAVENQIARIISAIGASPVEWKLLNMIDRGGETVTGGTVTADSRMSELFEAVCTASDFPRKYSAYQFLMNRRSGFRDGPLRGIGIAFGVQQNGFTGRPGEKTQYAVEVTMETDGRVSIRTGFHSAPMRQILAHIAAQTLGIEQSLISCTGSDTSRMPPTGPDTLSSKIAILAPLVGKCCASIQRQRFRQPLPITVRKTLKPPRAETWRSATLSGTPFVSSTPGVCAVELELDPVTYESSIRGIWLAADAGELYNRQAALTTIRKTIPLALSKMLAEHIVIRNGMFTPRDSVQYDLLPPSVIPEMTVTFLKSANAARGIGSLALNLVPAAYAAALAQITGSPVTSIPLDNREVYALLEKPEAKP